MAVGGLVAALSATVAGVRRIAVFVRSKMSITESRT